MAASPHWYRWLWLSVGVLLVDQATKGAILANIREGDSIGITTFFSLVLTYNTGAAFSFLAGASGWQRWFFTAIAVIASIVIVTLLRRGGSKVYAFGLALVLGGAIGNLIDRILIGKVVDFLLFHYQAWAYPAFNVADSAITVGATIVIIDSLRRRGPDPAQVPKGIR